MLKLKDVIILKNTLDMLEEMDLGIIPVFTTKEFEEAKKSKPIKTTCSLDTLKRLKLVEISKKEKVTIKLQKPITVQEVYINGQKTDLKRKQLSDYNLDILKNTGVNIEIKECTLDTIEKDKYYYKVNIEFFKKTIKNYCEVIYSHEIFSNFKKAQEDYKKYFNLMEFIKKGE